MRKIYVSCLILIALSYSDALFSQVTINFDQKYQTIEGFGGFGPKEVWWSNTSNYYDPEYMNLIINDLGVNIIRTQLYWDFEPSNDNGDPNTFNWAGFNISSTSNNGRQFPFMTDLDTVPEMKQIASVWTPPIWMKLDVDNSLANFCNGQCGGYLNPALYDEFAEYCVAYVKTIKNETGVDLYGLSLQNELLYANAFESCVYTPDQYAAVLGVVGKRFKEEGLKTKIFGPEHMGSYTGNLPLFNSVFSNTDAGKYLDIYAVHGYQDGVNPTTGSATGWQQMYDFVHSHGKELWMTETSGYDTNWDGALSLGYSVMLALKYGKISAWVHWYMSGNLMNNNVPNKKFYALKNFYKYIRPDAVMIDAESPDQDIIPVAFRNDKKGMLTLVIMNMSATQKSTTLDFNLPESMHFYRSSASENFAEVTPLNGNTINLPAKSITTMVAYTTNMAPTLNTSTSDTVILAGQGQVVLGLGNITNGGDNVSTVESVDFSFSDPSLISSSSLVRITEQDSAVMTFTPDPAGYGQTVLTVKVSENTTAENGAFNAFSTRQVNVKIIPYINQPPQIDQVGPMSFEPFSGLQHIKLTGVSDGNTNDGRESLTFTLTSRQGLLTSRQVKYVQGSDTAQMIFSPKAEGLDTLDLFIKDNFGTDLGGIDQTHIIIPVNIEKSEGISPAAFSGVHVYPVPAGNEIRIFTGDADLTKCEMYDMTGRMVLRTGQIGKSTEKMIPLTNLENGLYVLKLYRTETLFMFKKIIIRK